MGVLAVLLLPLTSKDDLSDLSVYFYVYEHAEGNCAI